MTIKEYIEAEEKRSQEEINKAKSELDNSFGKDFNAGVSASKKLEYWKGYRQGITDVKAQLLITEAEPMKVELDIRGCVIDGVQTTPENISVYVRDYDVEGSEEGILKDEDGDEYILKEF